MEKILFLSHTEKDGFLSAHALEALGAAAQLREQMGGDLVVGLFGGRVETAQVRGAVYSVSGDAFAMARYATDAAAGEQICKAAAATIVIAPGTSRMSRAFSGIAARCGASVDSHVTGLEVKDGALIITRWYYRQRLQARMTRASRPWFLSIDSGVFAPFADAGDTVIERLESPVDASLTRTVVKGIQAPHTDAQTIKPDAMTLFVAGAGWTKKQSDGRPHVREAADLILGFLQKSGASLGSTKSLVDLQGEGQEVLPFMTHLNQVGQTGSTPRHQKGLAACCHGEEPHVVGWRFINERRAINLDANCGWARGKADVLYVADAFQVMELVNELLSE
ncbi:electron transfer flavoprotein subunit alpha [candidate division KSB1 bacterium]|nr:electron transfer flavoprotein subunit alpha [candidate division KSB1 bacterium]RQW08322.1 MAG: electron transfer flavoprotein subunit alpha [candidate division KSB1 bacterium]